MPHTEYIALQPQATSTAGSSTELPKSELADSKLSTSFSGFSAGYLSSDFAGTASAYLRNVLRQATVACEKCNEQFLSKNRLHQHLKEVKHNQPALSIASKPVKDLLESEILEKVSIIPPYTLGTGLSYCGYTYMAVDIKLAKDGPVLPICWDTGCNSSLAGCSFLNKYCPDIEICKIVQLL
jgi:hypothetical protein